MATIRKPTYTIPIPASAKLVARGGRTFAQFARDGKRAVCPLTKDGTKCRIESDFWYVRYKDLDGKWKETKAYTDKRASESLALRIQERVDQKQEAINPFKEEHERALSEHLTDWEKSLRAKGKGTDEADRIVGRVRRVLDGCEFQQITDLDSLKVEDFLAQRRADPEKPMSVQTHNFYVQALRRFCAWLVEQKRTGENRLANVAMLEISEDRRTRNRRALSPAEFNILVGSALTGPTLQGVPGPDRAMLYILAAWTGYRRAELASLTLRSFDLDAQTPAVSVKAGRTKNKRAATIPLHLAVVERLTAWFATRGEIDPDAPLFDLKTPSGYWKRTADMMKADLERAGLSYQDDDGLFADFHANRHTFISNLAREGVPLTTAQKLARHSDPKLTANVYTHLTVCDQAAAIQSLPAPPEFSTDHPPTEAKMTLAATGTHGREAGSFPQASQGTLSTAHGDAQT